MCFTGGKCDLEGIGVIYKGVGVIYRGRCDLQSVKYDLQGAGMICRDGTEYQGYFLGNFISHFEDLNFGCWHILVIESE